MKQKNKQISNNIMKKMMPIMIICCLLLTSVGMTGCIESTATESQVKTDKTLITNDDGTLGINPSIWGDNIDYDGTHVNSVDTTGGGDGYRSDSSIQNVVEAMTHTQIDFNNIALREPSGTSHGYWNGTSDYFTVYPGGTTWLPTAECFQLALNSLNNTGGTIMAPIERISLDDWNHTIYVPGNVSIIGPKRGHMDNDDTMFTLNTTLNITILKNYPDQLEGFEFKNINFEGGGNNHYGWCAINLTGSASTSIKDWFITDCIIQSFAGYGIFTDACGYGEIIGNRIQNIKYHACIWMSDITHSSGDWLISENDLGSDEATCDFGIYTQGEGRITDNKIFGTGTNIGIKVLDAGCLVSNNWVNDCEDIGIYYYSSGGNVVCNRILTNDDDHSGYAIDLANANRVAVAGNIITTASGKAPDYAIRMASLSHNNTINGNVISGNAYTSGLLSDSGKCNIFNGIGTNNGDPRVTGNWYSFGKQGDLIVDTTTGIFYLYSGSSWSQLGSNLTDLLVTTIKARDSNGISLLNDNDMGFSIPDGNNADATFSSTDAVLKLKDSNSESNTAASVSFRNSTGSQLGYMGFAGNDYLQIIATNGNPLRFGVSTVDMVVDSDKITFYEDIASDGTELKCLDDFKIYEATPKLSLTDTNSDDGNCMIHGYNQTGTDLWRVGSSSEPYFDIGTLVDTDLRIIANGTVRMLYNTGIGHFGINTTTPDAELEVHGAIHCTGKLTSDGGNDPPYVLYNKETLESVSNRINKEVPKNEEHKWDGQAIFYNAVIDNMMLINPKTGDTREFVWKTDYEQLEQRLDELESRIEALENK